MTFESNRELSYQCQSWNLDRHGYCDGLAIDGERCECESCEHPVPVELGY
jgi:hypothetical protein